MASGFQSLHFNVTNRGEEELRRVGVRAMALRGGPPRAEADVTFNSDEAAARFYLSQMLQGDARPALRSLSAPQSPEVVPDMRMRDAQRSRLTETSTIRFVQTKASIPIFGSRVTV